MENNTAEKRNKDGEEVGEGQDTISDKMAREVWDENEANLDSPAELRDRDKT